MQRIFALFVVFLGFALAAGPEFSYTYEFSLKKNERASVEITELAYPEKKQNFDFYWTLFDTNKIIVHSKFRKYPRQFTLAKRRNLNWARQTLIPDFSNPHIDRASLILEFSDFVNNEAKFTIYIEDKESRLAVEFLDPNKMQPPKASDSTKVVPGIWFNEEKNATANLPQNNETNPPNLADIQTNAEQDTPNLQVQNAAQPNLQGQNAPQEQNQAQ